MHWMMVTSALKLIFRKDPDLFFLFLAQTWFFEQFSAAFLNSHLHCNLCPPPPSLCVCVCTVRVSFYRVSVSWVSLYLLLCGNLQGLSFSGFIVAPPVFLLF